MDPQAPDSGASGPDAFAARDGAPIGVGDWVLDPVTRRVSRGGTVRSLEPKMLDVLLLLAERSGEVVDREVIERTVWSTAVIGTDALNRTIWKLRRTLDDEPAAPRYIETIPRRGYRLIAPVSEPGTSGTTPSEVRHVGRKRWPSGALGWVSVGGALIAVGILVYGGWGSPDGSALDNLVAAPLTTAQGYESNPAVSPDGRYVAFQSYDPGGPSPSWNVSVMSLESGEEVKLASSPDLHEYAPAWAPAGDSIAYVRSGDQCEVVVQALDAPPTNVAACAPDHWHDLAWLSGGDLVLASSAPGQSLGLERVLRATGQRLELTVPPAGYRGDWFPRVSPGGDRLAFVRQRTDEIGEVHVIELDPGQTDMAATAVTSDARRIRGLTWDPGGRWILFTSARRGIDKIWRMDVAGGAPEAMHLPGQRHGSISAARGVLVYEEYRGDSDLWVYAPTTGRVEPWHGSSRSEWGVSASPDGANVAFVSDRTGSDEIWVAPTGGGEPRRVSRLAGAPLDPPQWSPGSRQVAFAAATSDNYDIFVLDIVTGALEQITDTPQDERDPTWWQGAIVYSANRTGVRELWILDMDRRTSSRLTSGGGWVGRSTASGEELYFTRPGRRGVWRLSGREEEPLRFSDGPGQDEGSSWHVEGSGVLQLRSTDGTGSELVRSGSGSTPETVLARMPHEASPRMGVTKLPDGRILFGVIVRSESDLWIAR